MATYRLFTAPDGAGAFDIRFEAASLAAAQTYAQSQATLTGVKLRMEYSNPNPALGVANQTFTPEGGNAVTIR
jgi:hypothetical protein